MDRLAQGLPCPSRWASALAQLALVFPLTLALAACGGSTTPTMTHQTYLYDTSSGPAQDTWRAGQALTVTWTARPGQMSSDSRPARVVLSVKLYGPFASADAAKTAMTSGTGPLAVSGPEIATDNWHPGPWTATLALPGSLAPGTYDLAQSASTSTAGGSVTARGDGIIVIGPA